MNLQTYDQSHEMNSTSQIHLDETAVENFREYLRIPSVQPDVNYDDCVAFLRKQAQSLDLPIKVVEHCKGKPFVIITWIGKEPSEPSILLNSHMDVVPVFAENWKYPPFSAEMDEAGNIYARGSQDMKCVGIQYLEAIRRLKLNNQRLKRTIHVLFTPDEEISGIHGMQEFVHTEELKKLRVGFALDEGIPSQTNDHFYVLSGDKSTWHVWVHCPGDPGHGSLMKRNNAGEKVQLIIDKFMNFRAKECAKIPTGKLPPTDMISVNLTQLRGGVQSNVVPDNFIAVFDLRLPPTADHDQFEKMINEWCKEAGEGVHFTFETKVPKDQPVKLDSTNKFWTAFESTFTNIGIHLDVIICPARTDALYLRSVGIPAIGFSPIDNTEILAHDNNENLNKDVFLQGIEIYTKMIPAIANV